MWRLHSSSSLFLRPGAKRKRQGWKETGKYHSSKHWPSRSRIGEPISTPGRRIKPGPLVLKGHSISSAESRSARRFTKAARRQTWHGTRVHNPPINSKSSTLPMESVNHCDAPFFAWSGTRVGSERWSYLFDALRTCPICLIGLWQPCGEV